MRSQNNLRAAVVFVGGLLAVVGCASLTIKRVKPDDYTTEGVRFYLPRPYVVVKQPFPVAGQDFLTTGTLQGDDRLVHINLPSGLPKQVLGYFNALSDPTKGTLPPSNVLQPRPSPSPTLEKEGKKSSTKGAKPSKDGTADGGSGSDAGRTPSDAGQTPSNDGTSGGGISASADIGSTSGSVVVPLCDAFDLVMMPDFTQQYAVNVNAGWGTSSLKLSLKNGWMADQFGLNADNSAIGNFILGNAQKVVDLGLDLAKGALGPASALGAVAGALVPHAAGAPPAPPVQVVLRVRYAVEALPGLYPVLKPDELVHPASADEKVWIPYPPYTVVGYSVRVTIVVELISMSSPAATPGAVALKEDEKTKLKGFFSKVPKWGKVVNQNLTDMRCGNRTGELVLQVTPGTVASLPEAGLALEKALPNNLPDGTCGHITTVLIVDKTP
jgi:hypothetical protein